MKKSKRFTKLLLRTFSILLVFAVGSLRLTAKADTLIGFNEGGGSTVRDSEGSASGTITNAVWKPESECLSGSCLYFDGTGDYVSFGDDSSFDFTAATNFTIEFWFRTGDITSGTRVMVSKYRGNDVEGGYKVYMSSDGKVNFGVDDDNSWGPDDIATSVSTYDDNLWHHVVATKTGTTGLTLYIDAVRAGQDLSISATGTLVNNDPLALGVDSDLTNNLYTGYLDELKIYTTTARSETQVKTDYQKASTITGNAATFGPDTSYLTNGLVGYWKLDNVLTDSSGLGYTLTNGGATTFVTGKYGFGSEHVPGSSQYLYYTSTTISGVKSVSFWVNPDNTTNYYFSLTTGAYLTSSGTLQITGFTNPKVYVNGQSTVTITADVWQLVTVTSDTAIEANQFYIGRQSGNYFDGTMDEVRLYNRTLPPSEVANLYSWAPGPVGYWKLDEGTGIYAYDSSGNNLTGTLTSGPVWTTGKYSSGVTFSGTNDYITVADNTTLQPSNGSWSVSFWANPANSSQTSPLITKRTNSGFYEQWSVWICGDNTCMTNGQYLTVDFIETNTGNYREYSTSIDVVDGNWHHYAVVADSLANTISIYIDGAKAPTTSSVNGSWPTINNADPLRFGNSNGTAYYNNSIDDIRIYNYARTETQILSDMNASHPTPGSPIGSATGLWHLDEGSGTTAYDSSVNKYNLTLSSASWTTAGKFDHGFKGASNTRLSITDKDLLDFAATDGMTLSVWFKRDTISAYEYLIYKQNGAEGYEIYMDADGDIVFGIGDTDTVSFPEETIGGSLSKNYDDNKWHHAVAVKNGNSSIRLYVDGIEIANDTSLIVDKTLENTGTFYIADGNATDDTDEFLGTIDEVAVYRQAFTQNQIQVLYNQGKSAVMGSLSSESSAGAGDQFSAAREFCVPGDTASCSPPAAWYKMDDMNTTTLVDSSGNGYDGTTLGYTDTEKVTGKYNRGLLSLGLADGVQILTGDYRAELLGGDNTSSFTLETYIKLTNGVRSGGYWSQAFTGVAFAQTANGGCTTSGGLQIEYTSATTRRPIFSLPHEYTSDCNAVTTIAGDDIDLDRWYHIAAVYNASDQSMKLYVDGVLVSFGTWGGTGSWTWSSDLKIYLTYGWNTLFANESVLDDYRIYNYARTPAQIAWDYNRGEPVAHYKLDECTGTDAHNSAVNGNGTSAGMDGTITIGGTGDYTAAGTCSGSATDAWKAGATGKFNGSIGLDGTNDYIDLGTNSALSPASAVTISAWIKTDTTTGSLMIYDSRSTDASGTYLMIESGMFNFGINNASELTTTGFTPNIGQWYHVVATYDSTLASRNQKIYIDGILKNSINYSTSISGTDRTNVIGARYTKNNYYWNGLIDDVRVYNYVLTPTQIQTLYNGGSALRF
jgi:hypothetical protein